MRNLAIRAPLTEHTAQNIWQLWVGRETVGWRVVWRPREEVFDLGSARKKVRGERRADCQIAHRKPPHPQDPVGPPSLRAARDEPQAAGLGWPTAHDTLPIRIFYAPFSH